MQTKLTGKHTVLWADDDPDDLQMMREVLENVDARHKMVEANNGRQALNYLDALEHPSDYPCIIILDINMPILNGRETLALIRSREKYNDIPVVMFTTSCNEKDLLYCRNLGAEMFTKPCHYSGLQKMVDKLLSLCRKVENDADTAAFN